MQNNMNTYLHKRLEEAAEYGYKEAIKIAKDWLLNNASNYESSITGAAFHQQLAEAFETYMNKLLEEKK